MARPETREGSLILQENVPLAPYTTLGVGGPARWFATAHSEQDVVEVVRAATTMNVPLFVLGGGSNLLVADTGFAGVVLHMALSNIEVESIGGNGRTIVHAAAGTPWDDLVQYCVDRDLAGMECLAGIPGTTGGTPVQNVGAYGQEVSQTIVSVRCLDRARGEAGEVVDLSNADCGFAYRTSLLNSVQAGRLIVLRVSFALRHGGTPNLSYADLKRIFPEGSSPTLRETADAVRTIRRSKGMVVDPADPDSRSAGSFFRNPVVPVALLDGIAQAVGKPAVDVPHWAMPDGKVKLPAAWLLERAGFLRGTTLGNAGISSKHTLALINRGGASSADIGALRDRIVGKVLHEFGITLEQEPVNVG